MKKSLPSSSPGRGSRNSQLGQTNSVIRSGKKTREEGVLLILHLLSREKNGTNPLSYFVVLIISSLLA